MSLVVHGDDFTCLGTRADLEWYEGQMAEAFEIKVRGHLGESEGCEREIRVLNRILRLDEHGLYYEADPRHAELIVRALDIQAGQATPGAKDDDVDLDAILGQEVEAEPDHADDHICSVLHEPSNVIRGSRGYRLPGSTRMSFGSTDVQTVAPYP